MLDIVPLLLTVLVGLCAGGLSTFFGLGGGVLFVTVLPIVHGMDPKLAIGTSLLTVLFLVIMNTLRFHRERLIAWRVVFLILPAAAVAAFVGGRLAYQVPDRILVLILAVTLLVLGIWTFLRGFIEAKPIANPFHWFRISGVGFISGLASGLTGIGAGAINSAFLLNWKIVSNEKMAPTANAIMVITTFSGVFAYTSWDFGWPQWGDIRVDLSMITFASAFITARLGHRHQARLPEKYRKIGLAVLMFGLTIKEFYRYFNY